MSIGSWCLKSSLRNETHYLPLKLLSEFAIAVTNDVGWFVLSQHH